MLPFLRITRVSLLTEQPSYSQDRFCLSELDVAVEKAKCEEIRIPFGVGVAGTVAQTKQLMNIRNAYEVSIIVLICLPKFRYRTSHF